MLRHMLYGLQCGRTVKFSFALVSEKHEHATLTLTHVSTTHCDAGTPRVATLNALSSPSSPFFSAGQNQLFAKSIRPRHATRSGSRGCASGVQSSAGFKLVLYSKEGKTYLAKL
jgi:hypothetical protein